MEQLGFYQPTVYVPVNATNTTLHDFENTLARTTALMYWAGTYMFFHYHHYNILTLHCQLPAKLLNSGLNEHAKRHYRSIQGFTVHRFKGPPWSRARRHGFTYVTLLFAQNNREILLILQINTASVRKNNTITERGLMCTSS